MKQKRGFTAYTYCNGRRIKRDSIFSNQQIGIALEEYGKGML